MTQYIHDLEWHQEPEVRLNAIVQLQQTEEKDLHNLVMPISKAYWDGAAEVLVQIGYPRVAGYGLT